MTMNNGVTLEAFRASLEAFSKLPKEAKLKRFRGLGFIGPNGGLTTRYGGDEPLDTEAIAERERELAAMCGAHGVGV